jgi:hypothetical protein
MNELENFVESVDEAECPSAYSPHLLALSFALLESKSQ